MKEVRGYLRWLSKRWAWMLILASQALVVVLPTSHRLQYALILFWAILASLYNHLSDGWRDMYIGASERHERQWTRMKNAILNQQNPENS